MGLFRLLVALDDDPNGKIQADDLFYPLGNFPESKSTQEF